VIRRLPALFQAPEDDLQAGLLDMAIGFFPEAHSLRPGIHSKHLLFDENVCVVSANTGAALSKLTLKRYCSLDHVSIFYQKDELSLVDRLLFEKGLRRTIAVQVPHLASALTIVARTKLATIVPRRFAFDFARRLPLRCLAAPLHLPRLHLNLLWHARSDSDPGLASFRKQIANISAKCSGLNQALG
jgi:DNA-binding transcriptional LysR family regulator